MRACLRRNLPGPYQLQAAIAAVHSDAADRGRHRLGPDRPALRPAARAPADAGRRPEPGHRRRRAGRRRPPGSPRSTRSATSSTATTCSTPPEATPSSGSAAATRPPPPSSGPWRSPRTRPRSSSCAAAATTPAPERAPHAWLSSRSSAEVIRRAHELGDLGGRLRRRARVERRLRVVLDAELDRLRDLRPVQLGRPASARGRCRPTRRPRSTTLPSSHDALLGRLGAVGAELRRTRSSASWPAARRARRPRRAAARRCTPRSCTSCVGCAARIQSTMGIAVAAPACG